MNPNNSNYLDWINKEVQKDITRVRRENYQVNIVVENAIKETKASIYSFPSYITMLEKGAGLNKGDLAIYKNKFIRGPLRDEIIYADD